jgi:hypothetical protein
MTAQQLYTRERLAAELGRDRRFISKVLANVTPDGRCGRYPAWRLTTLLPLLDGRERLAPPDMQKLGAEAQRAADDLQDGFDRLKREPSISIRRNKLMRKVGPLVGRFFDALDATAVGESQAERVCNSIVRDRLKGLALAQFADLLEARFREDGSLVEARELDHGVARNERRSPDLSR